jgi:DnaJ-class molecular chaperone
MKNYGKPIYIIKDGIESFDGYEYIEANCDRCAERLRGTCYEYDGYEYCEKCSEELNPCPECNGTGESKEDPDIPCKKCMGLGSYIEWKGFVIL